MMEQMFPKGLQPLWDPCQIRRKENKGAVAILTTASPVQLVASPNGLSVTFSNHKGEKRSLEHGKKREVCFP